MCKYKHGQNVSVLVCKGEEAWLDWCLAIWYEAINVYAKVSNKGSHFLSAGPKAIWPIYFKEI